jgi:hypothetical protein
MALVRIVLACAVAIGVVTDLGAQQPTWSLCGGPPNNSCGSRNLKRREREEAQALHNAPSTQRERGPFTVMRDSTVRTSLAIVGGPVRIAGTVTGSLLVLNGDVTFAAGAQVGGDVVVLGGQVLHADSARLGSLRVEPDTVQFTMENGDLQLAAPFDELWGLIGRGEPSFGIGLRLALTRTYNRVEGLPIEYGPRLRYRTPLGVFAADVFGIFRTADRLEWRGENFGHNARAELRFGRNEHLSVGARLYDVVTPVEDWQLSDREVGVATFLTHTDYRDYFDRQGGSATFGYRDGRAFRAALELSDEQWRPRATLDPFTLTRNNEAWRPNPEFDRARYQRAQLRLTYDTRTDPDRPRSGWLATGEYEFGSGDHEDFGTETLSPRSTLTGTVRYGRVMLDLRRYTRLSPSSQLNARLLVGGWAHGDPLPLQRRLSVSGPGANSGFRFRDASQSQTLQCSAPTRLVPGTPALCDRLLLLSADYRHDIRWLVDLFGGSRMIRTDRSGSAGWMLFSDVGRGWLTNPRDLLSQTSEGLQGLQPTIGAGLELGQGGVYIAKAFGSMAPANAQLFVRLVQRF